MFAVVQGLVDNDQEDEEEFEVDIQEDEAAFLKGISSRSGVEMSPIKIVKNPDGSLQRAAMTQSALAKERRELREQQQRTLIEAIPKDLSRPWEDPLPDQGERHLAQELRGIGLGGFEVPEWKKQAEGKVLTSPNDTAIDNPLLASTFAPSVMYMALPCTCLSATLAVGAFKGFLGHKLACLFYCLSCANVPIPVPGCQVH